MRVILASASPRRKELLGTVCESFEIIVSSADETVSADVHPKDSVRILAERKGRAVFDLLNENQQADSVVISSDTLVELDGEPLGKPVSESDAYNMLRSLSGKRHNVHTGIAIHCGKNVYSATATTGVFFREMSDDEIYEYIKSGEPMDKAGSYGIQGLGGKFVDKIEGDFDTVVGFCIKLLLDLAKEAGVEFLFSEK